MGAASTASESETAVKANDQTGARVRRPKALRAGSRLAVIAPASPGHSEPEGRGVSELKRLGFLVERREAKTSEGYFSASGAERRAELLRALRDPKVDAVISLRGGYGSNYLLDEALAGEIGSGAPK